MTTKLEQLDSIKRLIILYPLLVTYCLVIGGMAYSGEYDKALLSIGSFVSGVCLYYFGDHKSGVTPVEKADN